MNNRRWIWVAILVFLTGIGAGALYTVADSPDRANQWLAQADQAFASGHYEEALSLYKKAATIKSKSPEVQRKIELTEQKLKQPQTDASTAAAPPQSTQPAATVSAKQTEVPVNKGEVPNLIGMTLPDAEKLLLSLNIRYEYYIEASDKQKNTVFKQVPEAGKPIPSGGRVTFYVSRG
ncbi:PASTA domain-containing protein [Effusibacillus lacus]|uniref:PASTA domain-containing protein n=1 Tax=Effusibacillus lacus TaxID=1348429 RepID=A0A292YQK8_9BACL|nr:PASTA domain-containing protein [Effusibacillus lacus]TCS76858.1 PASTA domain-containing protein [Effusibacillus lacus]GAX91191.1 hypothetical protein EFBL_2857 [Effusibacillus lacus]